jgi:predicted enzyme related to lactoylglutathione lyase
MPTQGSFCWVEANLENPERGKVFYGELFGWKSEDVSMPNGTYTMMNLGEGLAAGILKLPDAAKKNGAPPHWLAYVAVSDVPGATKKAKALGGSVLLEPTGMGPGKMSVIGDPTGAVLALWKSDAPMGTFLWGDKNTMCWAELTTTDPAAATKFYVEMFGWRTEVVPMGDLDYTLLYNGDQQIAGLMAQPKPMAEAKAPSLWTVYFDVADCDAIAGRAKELGGGVVMPPTDIPNVGRFAILTDPDGAAFAVIHQNPKK